MILGERVRVGDRLYMLMGRLIVANRQENELTQCDSTCRAVDL
jgi:hypothetical protein